MPPSLPLLSGRETIRVLEQLGFKISRRKGSHVVMRRGSSGCVIPDHRELKKGTLAGVLRQAGVSRAEFVSAVAKE